MTLKPFILGVKATPSHTGKVRGGSCYYGR